MNTIETFEIIAENIFILVCLKDGGEQDEAKKKKWKLNVNKIMKKKQAQQIEYEFETD